MDFAGLYPGLSARVRSSDASGPDFFAGILVGCHPWHPTRMLRIESRIELASYTNRIHRNQNLVLLGACNRTHVVFPCKSQMRVHSTGQTIARTSIADARGLHLAYGVGSPFASIAYYTIVQACSCVVPMQEPNACTFHWPDTC